ncbi:alpha/beta hydrolase [Tatumella terrea]|uniref:Alpha/beta hydrolase n=1 Tax=Tatumella terrea TaxID=419007 RepID=A0ABW1VX58_9GAMM
MNDSIRPETLQLSNADSEFDVTLFRAKDATECILFASGLGGNPLRHLEFLQGIARQGISVIAPHFELLSSPFPVKAELLERVQRLDVTAAEFCTNYRSLTGVGHSLGTVILLMQAGAIASTRAREEVAFNGKKIPDRLVLLAPPADFFRAPRSLNSVRIPVEIWMGAMDKVTPPSQAIFLNELLKEHAGGGVHIIEDAGHFTFMNTLPPQVIDPHPSRNEFLQWLAGKVSQFIA